MNHEGNTTCHRHSDLEDLQRELSPTIQAEVRLERQVLLRNLRRKLSICFASVSASSNQYMPVILHSADDDILVFTPKVVLKATHYQGKFVELWLKEAGKNDIIVSLVQNELFSFLNESSYIIRPTENFLLRSSSKTKFHQSFRTQKLRKRFHST